jgi:hypothetical protein
LRQFPKKVKKNKNKKALVLCDPSENFIDKIKLIECICNDLDYKIIRLDELENQKINKLNKISEATQSQRLSCLPETLNEKLKILERIVNNDHMKLNYLINNKSPNVRMFFNLFRKLNRLHIQQLNALLKETLSHIIFQKIQKKGQFIILFKTTFIRYAQRKKL